MHTESARPVPRDLAPLDPLGESLRSAQIAAICERWCPREVTPVTDEGDDLP